MSLLEGHGDVTMDRAGADRIPNAARFGRVLRQRRQQAQPGRQAAPEADRPRGQAQPVRAGRAVHRGGRGGRRHRSCSTGPGRPRQPPRPRGDPRPGALDRPGAAPSRRRLTEPALQRAARAVARPRPDDAARAAVHVPAVPGTAPSSCARVRGRRLAGPAASLAVAAGLRGHRRPRRPRAPARLGGRGRRRGRRGRALRRRLPGRAGRRSAAGPNLEARARAARYAVAPGRRAHRAHRRRPGRDGAAQPAARRRARRAGRHARPARRRPLLGLRRSRDRALCAALGLEPVDDPINADPRFRRNRVRHEVLPLLDDVAERDVVPVLARQADLAGRRRATCSTPLAADRRPDRRPRLARPRRAPLARRAVRAWLRPRPASSHPPDAATRRAGARRRRGGRRRGRRGPVGGGALGRPSAARALAARCRRPAGPSLRPGAGYVAAVNEPAADRPSDDPTSASVVVADGELQRAHRASSARRSPPTTQGRTPLLVGVLKGAFMFMADLARAIDLPVEFDFMAVSSLRQRHQDQRRRPHREGPRPRPDRPRRAHRRGHRRQRAHAQYLRRTSQAREPGEPRGLRPARAGGPPEATTPTSRYVGFRIPPDFVVGYGLDVAERYRNLPVLARLRRAIAEPAGGIAASRRPT